MFDIWIDFVVMVIYFLEFVFWRINYDILYLIFVLLLYIDIVYVFVIIFRDELIFF